MAKNRSDSIVFALVVSLLVVGLLSGLARVGWLVWGTTSQVRKAAPNLLSEYWKSCEDGGDSTVVGELWLTSEDSLHWPIISDASGKAFHQGVSWYSTTSLPGQPGIMAIAGTRITFGAPFERLLDLNAGDLIQVQDCNAGYVYEVIIPAKDNVVSDKDDWMLQSLPKQPGALPTDELLVLTTNQDLLPTSDRAVAVAKLIETTTREK